MEQLKNKHNSIWNDDNGSVLQILPDTVKESKAKKTKSQKKKKNSHQNAKSWLCCSKTIPRRWSESSWTDINQKRHHFPDVCHDFRQNYKNL